MIEKANKVLWIIRKGIKNEKEHIYVPLTKFMMPELTFKQCSSHLRKTERKWEVQNSSMRGEHRSPQPGEEMIDGMAAAGCEALSGEEKVMRDTSLRAQEIESIHRNLWAVLGQA